MDRIKVIIADDSDFVRDGMRIILSVDEDFEVLGCARDGKEALDIAMKERADVILMDIQMPNMDGIEATGEIVKRGLGKVLILTTFDDDELVERALKNGAGGYLIKNHTPDQLKQMIKSVYHGGNILDEQVFTKF
ncbi:MAG TPA: response regulator transcription factor, partial [Lachnospiraceae bacterium]|nr:response regulator transcription factor [Lachnospiraceae bacterium]